MQIRNNSNKIRNHAKQNKHMQNLGMAEGAMARTISELSKGNIQTLTTSPTKEMNMHFLSMAQVKNAYFICTPFFLLEERLKNSNLKQFNQELIL
ncbi:hypothetical protein AB2G88_24140 (plasmid) [Escherichia coli]